MENFKLYCLRHPITKEIRYIGVTSKTLKHRLKGHMRDTRRVNHRTCWINSLIRETLVPEIELISSFGTQEEVFEAEIQSIKRHKLLGYKLVNSCDGGKGTLNPSEETRKKRSLSLKGNPNLATQTGKRPSDESIEKAKATRAEWSKEKKIENSKNRSLSQKGKVVSNEGRRNMSLSKIGKPAHNKGKKMNPNLLKKQMKVVVDHQGNEYPSIKDAAAKIGVAHSSVSAVVTGRLKSVKGFVFKYKEEENGK